MHSYTYQRRYNLDCGYIVQLIIAKHLDVNFKALDTDCFGHVTTHQFELTLPSAKTMTIQCSGDHYDGIILSTTATTTPTPPSSELLNCRNSNNQ